MSEKVRGSRRKCVGRNAVLRSAKMWKCQKTIPCGSVDVTKSSGGITSMELLGDYTEQVEAKQVEVRGM